MLRNTHFFLEPNLEAQVTLIVILSLDDVIEVFWLYVLWGNHLF